MKNIRFLIALIGVLSIVSCNAQENKQQSKSTGGDKISVYYFHFTSRCVTCKTVETEAQQNIELLYPEAFKSGKITFESVNLDEPESKSISEPLGVNGQTLLIVKGNEKINLTNEGFMYARSNPEKFRQIMKQKLDKLFN